MHLRLVGFFVVSDSMVLGIVDALCGFGRIGKIKVVGYDGTFEVLVKFWDGSISVDVF